MMIVMELVALVFAWGFLYLMMGAIVWCALYLLSVEEEASITTNMLLAAMLFWPLVLVYMALLLPFVLQRALGGIDEINQLKRDEEAREWLRNWAKAKQEEEEGDND